MGCTLEYAMWCSGMCRAGKGSGVEVLSLIFGSLCCACWGAFFSSSAILFVLLFLIFDCVKLISREFLKNCCFIFSAILLYPPKSILQSLTPWRSTGI